MCYEKDGALANCNNSSPDGTECAMCYTENCQSCDEGYWLDDNYLCLETTFKNCVVWS